MHHKLSLLALLLLAAFACAEQVVAFPAPDDTAPMVLANTPLADATEMDGTTPISATFSEPLDPATVNGSTFTLFHGSVPLAGTVTLVGTTARFAPAVRLEAETAYTATILAGVTDLAGNHLAEEHVWRFKIGGIVDEIAPRVLATNPFEGAVGVAPTAPLLITFSEAMDPTTLGAAITLLDGEVPVAGAVSGSGLYATFIPTDPLVAGRPYTARVGLEATDLAGNPLGAAYAWGFTVAGDPTDQIRPQVVATNPADGAFGVGGNTQVIATFSEPMDPDSFEGAFTVRAGDVAVVGVITIVGFNAFFNPDDDLAGSTLYTATLTEAVTDLAGNALAVEYTWQFTTGFAPDDTRPTVTATVPDTDAVSVAVGGAVTATFSEQMDASTLLVGTFEVFDGVLLVPGAVTFTGLTATYTPTFPFNPDSRYTAVITDAAADLAGNTLASDHVWSFTTGALPDTRSPQVTLTVPAHDETGVSTGGSILVIFTEAMDPDTLTEASIVVQRLGVDVAGEVSLSGLTASFRPAAPLAPHSFFSAVVTTATRDLAGNRLAREFVWGFRTGGIEDSTRPRIVSTTPADLTVDVALNVGVSATFSEPMEARTFDVDTFVVQRAGVIVEGLVTVIGAEAVFHPNAAWLPDTVYSASIAAAASDLDGIPLGQSTTWTFTTGAIDDLVAPFVAVSYPADLALLVPASTAITATFSEAMNSATVNTATFVVAGPGGLPVVGTVRFDAAALTGTFTPHGHLLPATRYTVTVGVEALDLAGLPLVFEHQWHFTTGLVDASLHAAELGTLSSFVATAGAGLFNANVDGATTLNGNVGLSPLATCLGEVPSVRACSQVRAGSQARAGAWGLARAPGLGPDST